MCVITHIYRREGGRDRMKEVIYIQVLEEYRRVRHSGRCRGILLHFHSPSVVYASKALVIIHLKPAMRGRAPG